MNEPSDLVPVLLVLLWGAIVVGLGAALVTALWRAMRALERIAAGLERAGPPAASG